MNKNISINISGIIFHIEEDGYARLKDYLETISNYFSTYDDNIEIISDIESRVAEIFLSKLDDGKQIITSEDVSLLIETMGTVADFEAIEDDDPINKVFETESKSEPEEKEEGPIEDDFGKKKLHRDEKRKVIGGVASGIAYYLSIDPLWVRLIAVLLFFNVFMGAFSGLVFMTYVVLWIVVPGSFKLGDDEGIKKMFRDSESRVLGGVASGISAYFGVDVTLVRLLFVFSVFLGGTGLILYLIIWMITPEAHSITEKMQMQGEPVTLSNIENSVKEGLLREEGEESPLAKVLLFPFRVIAAVFGALGKLIGPFSKVIVEVARILAGLIVGMIGVSGMMALLISAGVMLGLWTGFSEYINVFHLPTGILAESVSEFVFLAVFLVSFIPFLFIALLGVSLLVKKMVVRSTLGWTMFGTWVACVIGLAFAIPNVVSEFSKDGFHSQTQTFSVDTTQVVQLKIDMIEINRITRTGLVLRAAEDSVLKLVLKKEAKGATRQEAKEHAQMINYEVVQDGNDLLFDSNFSYDKKAKFRDQSLDMILYIPKGQVFVMADEMVEIIENMSRSGYRDWHIRADNRWVFEDEGLQCLSCENDYQSGLRGTDYSDRRSDRRGDRRKDRYTKRKRNSQLNIDDEGMSFDLNDFSSVEAQGIYNIFIEQGDDYNVVVKGNDRYKEEVMIKKYGSVLEIGMSRRDWDLLENIDEDFRLNVYITMPDLQSLESKGLVNFELSRFKGNNLSIDLSGASSADLNLNFDNVTLDLSGVSSVDLLGAIHFMEADLSGASSLRAFDCGVHDLELSASGASNAKVSAEHRLTIETSGVSTVRYKGNAEPKVKDEDDWSTIKRADR